jgi:hypothetical protein
VSCAHDPITAGTESVCANGARRADRHQNHRHARDAT